MRYQEATNCTINDFRSLFNTMVQHLFANTLTVEGEKVIIPIDRELDYKIKYDTNENGHAFSFKISWENELHEDD